MTSNSIEASASAQLLDGDTVVVDRVAWERLNPDPEPDYTDGAWAYFGEVARAHTWKLGAPRVWAGERWGDADTAEQAALDMLRAVAWARQEAQS
ncbi:hypothetical protein GMA1_41 [Gordonia phage GMA1]|uniref:hypothetical protein n=1 Tax=Gordonia phage GMA1 TaxID=1647470 RepID=UPI0007B61975|nr:hypothetical protein BH788_gp41 [Gordonia phage GMA1]AKJ72138.1 hypothetical protein GMA1_41 [Gordonia phage GMA1]